MHFVSLKNHLLLSNEISQVQRTTKKLVFKLLDDGVASSTRFVPNILPLKPFVHVKLSFHFSCLPNFVMESFLFKYSVCHPVHLSCSELLLVIYE